MNKNWLPIFLVLGTIGCVLPAVFGIIGLAPVRGDAALPLICGLVLCNVVGFVGCGILLGSDGRKKE